MCMVVLPTFMCLDCVPSPLCNQEEGDGSPRTGFTCSGTLSCGCLVEP